MLFLHLSISRGRMAITLVKRAAKGRVFTIELDSGDALKKVSVPNGPQRLLLEGTIGSLRHAGFVEDSILELVGTKGSLRVDLSRKDLVGCGVQSQQEHMIPNRSNQAPFARRSSF